MITFPGNIVKITADVVFICVCWCCQKLLCSLIRTTDWAAAAAWIWVRSERWFIHVPDRLCFSYYFILKATTETDLVLFSHYTYTVYKISSFTLKPLHVFFWFKKYYKHDRFSQQCACMILLWMDQRSLKVYSHTPFSCSEVKEENIWWGSLSLSMLQTKIVYLRIRECWSLKSREQSWRYSLFLTLSTTSMKSPKSTLLLLAL